MNELLYKMGCRLSRLKFVRGAIDSRADLSEFRQPPNFRIFAGVLLICLSFPMCWPAISGLTALGIYWHHLWVGAAALVILYPLSHLVFLAGMALSGEKYTRIVFRWLARISVERLLALAPAEEESNV